MQTIPPEILHIVQQFAVRTPKELHAFCKIGRTWNLATDGPSGRMCIQNPYTREDTWFAGSRTSMKQQVQSQRSEWSKDLPRETLKKIDQNYSTCMVAHLGFALLCCAFLILGLVFPLWASSTRESDLRVFLWLEGCLVTLGTFMCLGVVWRSSGSARTIFRMDFWRLVWLTQLIQLLGVRVGRVGATFLVLMAFVCFITTPARQSRTETR